MALGHTAASRALARSQLPAPRLASKKTKEISLSVWQRGSRSYQMGCGQHPRSCQHSLPRPSCLLPLAVFSGKGSSGSTQTLSPQGTRPPQVASPPSHPLPSHPDCHTELTRVSVAVAILPTLANISNVCCVLRLPQKCLAPLDGGGKTHTEHLL